MRIFRTLTFTLAILMNLPVTHKTAEASICQRDYYIQIPWMPPCLMRLKPSITMHGSFSPMVPQNGRIAPRAVMSVRNRSGKIIRHGESAWPTSLVCCATAMLSDE